MFRNRSSTMPGSTVTRNTSLSNEFFGKNVTIIWYRTYFYIGKASSHDFQRSTHSVQKKSRLVKFVSLCLLDGYCFDSLGSFYDTENDATSTSHILITKTILVKRCDYGSVMIVNRGFRDVAEVLSKLGYESKIPVYLPKDKKQDTPQEANESRLVIKVRWNIESYHARLEKWRFFSERIENSLLLKQRLCKSSFGLIKPLSRINPWRS